MEHHVIYIPGIGDNRTHGQHIAVRYWRVFGLHAHYLPLGWSNEEGFDNKLDRLTAKIDDLANQGHKVSLCGVSAGASAVIAAYALRPGVNGIVTIAGKINNVEAIIQETRKKYPDFYEAAKLIPGNLEAISRRDDIKNVLCIYSQSDKTVPPEDAVITSGSEHRVPGWNHASGIFFGVVLGGPTVAGFLKSRTH